MSQGPGLADHPDFPDVVPVSQDPMVLRALPYLSDSTLREVIRRAAGILVERRLP
jgi:hypothetical protein